VACSPERTSDEYAAPHHHNELGRGISRSRAHTAHPAQAGTVVPQSGANPVVITPGTGQDDLVALPASAAERDSDIQVYTDNDTVKNFYVQSFTGTQRYLAWTVNVPAAAGPAGRRGPRHCRRTMW
jgi:hypothetical protein